MNAHTKLPSDIVGLMTPSPLSRRRFFMTAPSTKVWPQRQQVTGRTRTFGQPEVQKGSTNGISYGVSSSL
jgi:hypothetical protein